MIIISIFNLSSKSKLDVEKKPTIKKIEKIFELIFHANFIKINI